MWCIPVSPCVKPSITGVVRPSQAWARSLFSPPIRAVPVSLASASGLCFQALKGNFDRNQTRHVTYPCIKPASLKLDSY